MIPQRQVPQVPIGQAIANQNALLAQFQNARQMAQQAPVQAVQGQGVTPAQLMQYAQGNALQVRNRMDGANQTREDIDTGKDVRSRERFQEGIEKQIYTDDRADSRNIYNNKQADTRNDKSLDRADALGEKNADRTDKNTQQNFLNNKMIEGIRRANQRSAELSNRKWQEEFRKEGRDYADEKKRILQGDFGVAIGKPIRDYDQWHMGNGPGSKDEAMKGFLDTFVKHKAADPAMQARFDEEGLNGNLYPKTDPNYAVALQEFVKGQMGDKALSAEFMMMFNQSVVREEASLRAMKDNAWAAAFKYGVRPDSGQNQSPPNAQGQPPNALAPGAPSTGQTLPGQPYKGKAGTRDLLQRDSDPLPKPSTMVADNGITASQSLELIKKFPDSDENKDGLLTKEEMQAFINNPLIDEDTKISAVKVARYLGAGAFLYNTLSSKETGTGLAERVISNEKKAMGENPLVDEDSRKFEEGRVREEASKPKPKDAQKLKVYNDHIAQDKADLSKVKKKVSEYQKSVSSNQKMVNGVQKRMDDFRAKFGQGQGNPLGSHNMKGDDKVKMQKLEKTLSNYQSNLANAQAKLDKARDAQVKVQENLDGSVSDLDAEKARVEKAINTPNQAQVRSGISAAESKANMTHNTKMRKIGTKFGLTEAEVSKMMDGNRISESALRDQISKQDLGRVSHRVKRIVTAIKTNPKALAKTGGKLLAGGALLIGPELYDIANSIFDTQSEKDLAIKEFKEMIEAYKELNDLANTQSTTANPLTVDQNQSVGDFFSNP